MSDWIGGGVYRIAADGSSDLLIDLNMGSADLEYFPDRSLLIVPMMLDNTLIAYHIE